MSLGAEHPAGAPGWPVWPILLLLAGVATAALGVALNESGSPIGRVLILVGLPVATLGGMVSLWKRDRGGATVAAPEVVRKTSGAAIAVARASSRLGLELSGGRATGKVNKRTIELAPEANDVGISVRARMTRDLDMGLSVTQDRQPGDARMVVSSGDTAFDTLYCVRSDEPERGRQILTERLRGQLAQVDAQLDDSGARVLVPSGSDEDLAQAINLAGKVAGELDRASSHVPCAEPLRDVRDAWLAFAKESSLATADTPLSMWGEIDGLKVSAIAVRDAFQHFHFELVAKFPAPLNRGLAMRPASSATQFDRSGEPVGHPAFDKIFVVKSLDPTDSSRLVGPETREAILDLRNTGLQLRAEDTGMWAWVALNRSNAELVPRGLKRMAQIAARISSNAERFPPSGR